MNRKLLFVEDDPDALHFYETWLTRKGFTVYPLQSAKRALHIFLKERPAWVVMDIVLPGKGGVEAAADIRGTKPGKHTAIILITGVYNNVRNRLDAQKQSGADDCLFKPFPMTELLISLEKACRKRRGGAWTDPCPCPAVSGPCEKDARLKKRDRNKEAGQVAFLRGREYFLEGQFMAARRYFTTAVAADTQAEYIFYLAYAIERLCDKNWRQEAEAGYRAALDVNPYHAPAYFRLGRLLHLRARNAEAEENYRLALALKPDYNVASRALQRMTGAGKKKKKKLSFLN